MNWHVNWKHGNDEIYITGFISEVSARKHIAFCKRINPDKRYGIGQVF